MQKKTYHGYVCTHIYSYNNLLDDLCFFAHNNIETGHIGTSELGKLIPYIFIGNKNSANITIVMAAIHAREYATAQIAVWQAKELARKGCLKNADYGIYFVPILNVDGVDLCIYGLDSVPKTYHNYLININGGSSDFKLYKANANGVDLNTNFDARFGTGAQNVFMPASANYVGTHPHSAAEVAALVDFTKKIKPTATYSYHARGREVIYDFFLPPDIKQQHYLKAKKIADQLGYSTSIAKNSAGGYKDYCIQHYGIYAFTIEMFCNELDFPFTSKQVLSEYCRCRNGLLNLF